MFGMNKNRHADCVTLSAYNAAIDTWERKFNRVDYELYQLKRMNSKVEGTWPLDLGAYRDAWEARHNGQTNHPRPGALYPDYVMSKNWFAPPTTADSILARDLAAARKERDAARESLREQQEWTLAQKTVISQLQQKNDQLREQGHMDAQTINELDARTSSVQEVEANTALSKQRDQLRTQIADTQSLNTTLRNELSGWRSGRYTYAPPPVGPGHNTSRCTCQECRRRNG
jgi:hypothetical protein